MFEPVNMRNCGKRNFRKHRDIKKGDESVTYENKYEILKISEKFGILDMMETTSSGSKERMGGSGPKKGLRNTKWQGMTSEMSA